MSESIQTYIRSQNLKFESINNELVLTKIEPNPLDEGHKENLLNIHQECHEKMPIKPSSTIQEEISWKVQVDHLEIMLKQTPFFVGKPSLIKQIEELNLNLKDFVITKNPK